jgi:hypothetical protein
MDADYYPNGCIFTKRFSSNKMLYQCFREKNMKKMLVTGDSNSARLRTLLEGFPQMLNGVERCKVLAVSEDDISYFVVPNVTEEMIQMMALKNKRVECTLYDNFSYILERVPMIHLLDGTLRFKNEYIVKGNVRGHIFFAETRLEYLLKYYFPHVGFPDIWFYYVPFHHDTWGNTVKKIRADLSYVFDLMYIYLPTTTTVVLISDARECDERRPPAVGETFRAFWNRTRNECIHDMNHVLFEVFREKAPRHKNVYAFLDYDKISCPIQCTWHRDGAHMVPEFQAKMATYLLESYCAGTE